MKPGSFFILLFLFFALSLQSTPDISMDVARFKTDSIHYIELSLYIVGSSLTCDENKSSEYGVEYVVMIRDDKENIVTGNRYRLSRKGCPSQDIIDVKRFSIPIGTFTIEVETRDILDSLNVITITQEVEIDANIPTCSLSDIQLLSTVKSMEDISSTLQKNGLYMEPLPFRYYYSTLNTLFLYLESYHTEQLEGQPYLQYTIKPITGNIPVPIITYKRIKKETIAANIFQLDISALLSGPYILEAALFDGNKQIKETKQIEFSRLNPKGDSLYMESGMLNVDEGFVKNIPEDSLEYDMRAMAPIINSMDVDIMNTLLKKGSAAAKRFFIHRFWTNQAGKLAGSAFAGYMKVAKVVDENYRSGFGYGFETDRGHIFLKYGKPDEIIEEENEPSAPPYEIWFYTTFPATHQTNVRFLFYNPSLVQNGFILLHSTAIGERRNERWEVELYRDATLETPGVNDNAVGDNVFRNARKYFEY